MTVRYPTSAEVLVAHERLVHRFGGAGGLRDAGGLESALARPQCGYYQDLIEEAAALWESLSQNHPFFDGNKRVAVTTTMAFLRINGYSVEFDDLAAFEFLLGLYERGEFKMARLDEWLRQHAARLP